MHVIEIRLVIEPSNILFAGMYVIIFQPGYFTSCGCVGVNISRSDVLTALSIWLLQGWCHVKLLPSRRKFCVHLTAIHQFTVSPHSKPHRYGACVFSCRCVQHSVYQLSPGVQAHSGHVPMHRKCR